VIVLREVGCGESASWARSLAALDWGYCSLLPVLGSGPVLLVFEVCLIRL